MTEGNDQVIAKSVDENGIVFRDYENDGVKWRHGKAPNYSKVDKTYLAGRKTILTADSLELAVTKVVKNWEVESHHVPDHKQWKTMDISKFQAFSNDLNCPVDAETFAKTGSYNILLGKCPHFDSSQETFDSANTNFNTAFGEGFAWEVMEVHAGPPNLSFTWRHWGKHVGEYRSSDGTVFKPTNKMVEFQGHCLSRVNADLVIESVELFWDKLGFL